MPTLNAVTQTPAADSAAAQAHFQATLQFETDCADVHGALASGAPGFVLLDVRGPALFAQGHVPGALNLPHGKIVASRLADYPPQTLFVTARQAHERRHRRLARRRLRTDTNTNGVRRRGGQSQWLTY
ncbi:rhodanese-related sulfurtransferase [Paraburkholderia sp. BL6669N2]|nr:rhodanese-related sulfurtransferase [Paraburkholderia sp. BL6669N2]